MRELKFRAVIPERNTTIYFDLSDLVHPGRKDLFSKRVLLIPWLLAGNIPDQYTGKRDKTGNEIYTGDIDKNDGVIRWSEEDLAFVTEIRLFSKLCEPEIIGNIHSSQNG